MRAKQKKQILYGGLAVLAGVLFLKRKKNNKVAAMGGGSDRYDPAPVAEVFGAGSKAFFEEMGGWLTSTVPADQIAFIKQSLPDITESDIKAFYDGKRYGEVPNYTQQDEYLIDQVVAWQ